MSTEIQFTWRDMKRIVNKIPESRLDDAVDMWDMENDAKHYIATGVEILKEDYHDDGDVGTWKKSDILYCEENPAEYNVVYPKGTRIIHIE